MITEDMTRAFNDPAASSWLKQTMIEAIKRDPVDCANDAEILACLVDKSNFAGPDLLVGAGPGIFPALRLGAHRFTDGKVSSSCFNLRTARSRHGF